MNGPDDYVNTWQTLYDFSGKTTSLPIVPDSQAITGNTGSKVTGTVWAGEHKTMAAAMDHRKSLGERPTTLTLRLPKAAPQGHHWRVTRLSNRVQPIKAHGWSVKKRDASRLVLQGPLGPGEMVLLEHTESPLPKPAP